MPNYHVLTVIDFMVCVAFGFLPCKGVFIRAFSITQLETCDISVSILPNKKVDFRI